MRVWSHAVRHGRAGLLIAVALMAAEISSAATGPLRPVAVTIVESDGIERRSWPVTFGVPFPRSVLRDVGGIALVDEKGVTVPMQARELGRWDDGSVRWVLVDAQVSVAARQSLPLRLVAGTRGKPAAGMRVTNGEARVEVDTGTLRFAVPKAHFGVVEAVEGNGTAIAGPMVSVLERDGRRRAAPAPKQVIIREQGPLRVRIEIRGDYGNGFAYVTRLDAYAGQPFVRVLHTFVDRDPAPLARVNQIAVEWPMALGKSAVYAGGITGAAPQTGSLATTEVNWIQLDNLTYRIDGEEQAGTLEGWLSVRAGATAVGLSSRWFWQEYPQSFVLKPDRLVYHLWAPEAGAATVGMGAAKTHEFVFWVARREAVTRDWAAALVRPLVAVVDPEWVARSRALPLAIAPGALTDRFIREVSEGFDRYRKRNDIERWDDSGRVRCSKWLPARPQVGAYGMWNWGDWNFPTYQDDTKGCDAWGNLEYDTTLVLALGFVATRRPELYEAMVVAARHFMDVDTIHFQARRPEWVGMNHPKNPLHFSFELGGVDLGHTWSEGLLAYYYLTGDERGLDGARGIADYLERRLGRGIIAANPRQLGWPQIALLAVHEATGERRYLDAAHEYARRGMRAHPPGSVGHWKHGILADALAYTHAATHDAEIEQWLRVYVKSVGGRRAQRDARLLPATAYVAALTGDASLRAVALQGAERLGLGGWGKPFTLNGRLGFRLYSLLGEPSTDTPHAAETPSVSPSPAASPR